MKSTTSLVYCLFFCLLGIFLVLQCRKKDKNGYVCTSTECYCPEGKFEADGICRELEPNEYYGAMDDCPCNDTLFFKVLDVTAQSVHISHNVGSTGSLETWMNKYPLPDGDSISGSISDRVCVIGAQRCIPTWYGKFVGDDKIRITAVYYAENNPDIAVDTCRFIFKK